MTHTDGTFTGASGHDIFWQAWDPDEPKALVVLAHGVHEHSGRYAHVAERLNRAGYAVHTVDHEGHGRSGGTRGNIVSMKGLLEDFHRVRTEAAAEHPGLPVFVLGHSMGGLVALDYVLTYGEDGLRGLVVSAPAVDTSTVKRTDQIAAPILGRLLPNLGVVPLADEVSRDPAVVAAYEADPLNYNAKIRARTGAEMLLSLKRVAGSLPQLRLPVLVMHGSEDRIMSPAASRTVHAKASSTDKTLTVYDGLFHEIFNEPEKEQVLDDLVTWLDAHV